MNLKNINMNKILEIYQNNDKTELFHLVLQKNLCKYQHFKKLLKKTGIKYILDVFEAWLELSILLPSNINSKIIRRTLLYVIEKYDNPFRIINEERVLKWLEYPVLSFIFNTQWYSPFFHKYVQELIFFYFKSPYSKIIPFAYNEKHYHLIVDDLCQRLRHLNVLYGITETLYRKYRKIIHSKLIKEKEQKINYLKENLNITKSWKTIIKNKTLLFDDNAWKISDEFIKKIWENKDKIYIQKKYSMFEVEFIDRLLKPISTTNKTETNNNLVLIHHKSIYINFELDENDQLLIWNPNSLSSDYNGKEQLNGFSLLHLFLLFNYF